MKVRGLKGKGRKKGWEGTEEKGKKEGMGGD